MAWQQKPTDQHSMQASNSFRCVSKKPHSKKRGMKAHSYLREELAKYEEQQRKKQLPNIDEESTIAVIASVFETSNRSLMSGNDRSSEYQGAEVKIKALKFSRCDLSEDFEIPDGLLCCKNLDTRTRGAQRRIAKSQPEHGLLFTDAAHIVLES
mmetsp:Transcript_12663/g.26122  ORF Transcript_12663/g.26122 Transcript_12663/m.26122 type:complete len:154 (-) Transcript_12663:39-500(-)